MRPTSRAVGRTRDIQLSRRRPPCAAGCFADRAPGTTTAIVGSTGSGKSTLVSLICRLYDVTASVRIDDIDVRDYDTEQLVVGDRSGATARLPVLRHRRRQPALRQGRRHRRDVGGAARRGGRRIRARPRRRIAMPVAQGGINFSGGQRQRLAIARAVIRRPAIYLFDDAFSALDVHTDARVRAALGEVSAGARSSLSRNAFRRWPKPIRIIVIDDGGWWAPARTNAAGGLPDLRRVRRLADCRSRGGGQE